MLTQTEKAILKQKVEEVLAFSDKPLTIHQLQIKVGYTGRGNGFTTFIKNRFIISGGMVYLTADSVKANSHEDTLKNNDVFKKMAKAIENMALEIEALQKEIVRLNNLKSVPTLSERARKALAVYGD